MAQVELSLVPLVLSPSLVLLEAEAEVSGIAENANGRKLHVANNDLRRASTNTPSYIFKVKKSVRRENLIGIGCSTYIGCGCCPCCCCCCCCDCC